MKVKCNLIQNENLLIEEIPKKLKNLPFGVYPDDNLYNNSRFIYNKLFNYFPHAIYYPENERQISYLIRQFVKNNLQFTIRCGGHAYEPASLSDGYIIDVKKLSCIKVNTEKKTVTAGSGVKLGDLISKLGNYNLVTPTGESSCVGISGLALAGGKGLLTRMYGMTCDNILSLKMINPEGKIIKVDKKNNSDLFWAYKGAGICNFGVVYEYKLQTYDDIYCQLVTLTWNWNPEAIKQVLILYQKWILTVPDYITTDLNISYNNGTASLSIKFYKFNKIRFTEIDEFMFLNNPDIKICRGYLSKITDCWVSYDTGKAQPFSKMKSTMIFQPSFDDDYLNIFVDSINQLLEYKYNVVFQYNFTQMGGESKYGESSYFPKKAINALTIFMTWGTENLTNFCKSFTKEQYDKIIPFTSIYAFPNMIDYELEDYMNSYYGDNKDELIKIKTKYDPNNVFHWKQSIPVIN